jgi:hypothetical protein
VVYIELQILPMCEYFLTTRLLQVEIIIIISTCQQSRDNIDRLAISEYQLPPSARQGDIISHDFA